MIRRSLSFAALVLGVAITASGGGGPAIADQDPRAFVNTLGNQAIEVSGPRIPFEQRVARFHQLFNADFAVAQIGQFVMGPYSRTASPEQKQAFLQTFGDSIVELYAKRFSDYTGEQFQVTGVRNAGSETVVSSEIVRRGGSPVRIDWSLLDEGGQPKISDVTIDGVSMRAHERELFGSLMQQSGGRMDIALIALKNSNAPAEPGTTR
ncbi:MAG TPA: ABC transporter substrate-binding protein [Stellaceae bacterium]|jgi:phospholipid transport system substrate-binding protein|nr:ABC transporter substrate-binding protein [Stellaceae bacterium]